MAIPDNYIDKITKEGDSRMISPAANMVRVNNENFEGSDLDEVLDEVSAAIDEAGSGGYAPPPGGIPATDLAPAVQQTLDDVANKVDKETDKSLMTAAEHTKLQNLPSNPVQSVTINGSTPAVGANGNVNLGTIVGERGPQGPTGNVQVDGNGNVLIVNNLEDGGPGAALSAEMGKRLALKAGTYAGAWARSKAIIVPFCWLWQETVGGAAISKPIWHIGNSVFVDAAGGIVSVQASSVPVGPTFSETSGSTVGKGTELTITPDTDSALYYKIDNGAWNISDAAVTIEITATTTITAKCVNNAGSSSEETCSLTVSGPQAPSFEAAQGTTIASGDVVSRGGSIVVSVPQGGELHYSTDGTNYTTASGLSVTIPVPAAGVHIYAYNVQDNDQSAVVDHNYTMAALAAPSMSPANNTEFAAGGGTATITATEGDGIRYTTDDSDPRTSNTATVVNALTASVTVSSAVTIKACAFDDYGKSDLVQATYSVETAKLKVTASAATTMTLTKTDDTTVELTIAQGDNEFAIDTALGGVTTFASCAFGDKTLITKIDFGGITINSIEQLFSGCASLLECKNLFVNGSAYRAFYGCTNLASSSSSQLSLGGVITNGQGMLLQTVGRYKGGGVDLSRVTSITNVSQIFSGFRGGEPIDLSHTVVNVSTDNNTWLMFMFKQVLASTLIIGEFIIPSGVTRMDQMFFDAMITTIKCTTSTPPTLTCDWIGTWKTRADAISNATPKILVPAAAENAYKTASGWSTYANIMETY